MKDVLSLHALRRTMLLLSLLTWAFMRSVDAHNPRHEDIDRYEGHDSQGDSQQFSGWSAPQSIGSVVNSAFNDQHPAISPDGLSLYFVSDRPGGVGGLDLWVTHRHSADDPWQVPAPLNSIVNSGYTEFAPAFDPSGRLLFFGSDRPGGCGDRDLWVSFRKHKHDDFRWRPPVNLGCTVNFSGFDDGPAYFRERDDDDDEGLVTLYFTSQNRPGGLGDFDIWASTMNPNGSFNPPLNIAELNSPARDTRTAIRRDGLEIILTSQRDGGAGTLDLWVATRGSTSATWSTPVNLGPIVNSSSNDGAPALSRDGTTLYFYSNRPGGVGANDLYFVKRTKIRDHHRSHRDQ